LAALLPAPPVLLITDRHLAARPLEETVAAALAAGLRWLLLRDKDLAPAERRALARRLAALCRARDASLMISGDVALALEVGAAGAHLPRDGLCSEARARLGPDALIGLSAHDKAEALAAFRGGADYVTLSPVFASPSKPGYGPALGLARLAAIVGRLPGPVMGALLAAPDTGAGTVRLIRAVEPGQLHSGPAPAAAR